MMMEDKKRKPFQGTRSNCHGINSNYSLDDSPLYHCQMPPAKICKTPPDLLRLPALTLAHCQRGGKSQECDGHMGSTEREGLRKAGIYKCV